MICKSFILLSFLNIAHPTFARSTRKTSKQIHISGKVISNNQTGNDSIVVTLWNNYLLNLSGDTKRTIMPVDENGGFSFSLSLTDSIGIVRFEYIGASYYVRNYIVCPGDNIIMSISIFDTKLEIACIGPGSEKYSCVEDIEKRKYEGYAEFTQTLINSATDSLKGFRGAYSVYSKIFHRENQSLIRYKSTLHQSVYKLILSEIVSDCFSNWNARLIKLYSASNNSDSKQLITKVHNLFHTPVLSNSLSILSLSPNYLNYCINLEIINFLYTHHTSNYNAPNIYLSLKHGYEGILRDKLMVVYLIDPSYRLAENIIESKDVPKNYDDCIADASRSIFRPYLKTEIQKYKSLNGKGAYIGEFSFTDSAGNVVCLKDFINKVLLIDVYGTPCTGCLIFSKTLKNKILPFYAGNYNIAFITISIDNKMKWIKSLNDGRYTNPGEINLYTNDNATNDPFIKYFNIQGIPKIFLVDKNGKIITSNIDCNSHDTFIMDFLNNALHN